MFNNSTFTFDSELKIHHLYLLINDFDNADPSRMHDQKSLFVQHMASICLVPEHLIDIF